MTGCQLYASDARGAGARNSRLLLVHATSGNGPLLHLPARAARHTHGDGGECSGGESPAEHGWRVVDGFRGIAPLPR